jgi:uncharacterized protein DUF3617
MRMHFLATLLVALPLAAVAQGSGELWEITMSMPGMPAGMMPAQRVCQGDDPERAAQAQKGKDKKDCKVTDRKQSGNRTTISMSCSDGSTMVIDQQFNAARTEFKSTMSLKSKKDGDMTMTQTGRKIGACDAVATRKERDAHMDKINKDMAAMQAAGAAEQKKFADRQIKECADAAAKMDWRGFGTYGQCYNNKADANCKTQIDSLNKMSPEIGKSCNARVAEYCKRYQTQEGFLKAKADENAAQMCGVTTASVKAAQCPKAAQTESLAFLGRYCLAEAKPIAQQNCVGRDYTSKMGGKYNDFCTAYLAQASLEKPPASAADQVKQGVSKGMDKLKGLFGR